MSWTPADDVMDHARVDLRGDMDFFVDPPAEIGEIFTATTSLKQGRQPKPSGLRAAIAGSAAFSVGLVAAVIVHMAGGETGTIAIVGVLGGAISGLIAWYATGFRHTCSYVARNGVAVFRCTGDRTNVKETVFLFERATDLRTSQTRHYTNGVYTGTNYSFTWSDRAGRAVHRFSGSYNSQDGTPGVESPFHLASSAEIGWSMHLLERAQVELEKSGAIQFNLGGSDYIRVGDGFLELCKGREIERLEQSNFGAIDIAQGVFTLRRKDAREGFLGIGRSGVWTFPYATMANAKVFLLALDKLLGIKF